MSRLKAIKIRASEGTQRTQVVIGCGGYLLYDREPQPQPSNNPNPELRDDHKLIGNTT